MNEALGMIETKGFVGSVESIDAMAKAAGIQLVKQVPTGGGFLTIIVKGDVGSVKAAVDVGAEAAAKAGELIGANIIARPHPELLKSYGI
ncbi:MAG: BMC domain-containing protein [Puniceicoccales bacterium]